MSKIKTPEKNYNKFATLEAEVGCRESVENNFLFGIFGAVGYWLKGICRIRLF